MAFLLFKMYRRTFAAIKSTQTIEESSNLDNWMRGKISIIKKKTLKKLALQYLKTYLLSKGIVDNNT